VSAPKVYEHLASLVELWSLKTRYADGAPFRADLDVFMVALDITMAVVFDFPRENSMVTKQIADIKIHSQQTSNHGQGGAISFSSLPLDPELDACVYLINSIGIAFQSPLPSVTNWLYLHKPRSRRALTLKRRLIEESIRRGLKRTESQSPAEEMKPMCAVDQVLLREIDGARRGGVKPDFHKRAIYDEVSGRLCGGVGSSFEPKRSR
jgi:hypothetical protein